MAKDSPLGIFLFVSEWVVTALHPALFLIIIVIIIIIIIIIIITIIMFMKG